MRIIIVSNRLPFTITRDGKALKFQKSIGGLTSGLRSYLDLLKGSTAKVDYVWVGWPGIVTTDSITQKNIKTNTASLNAYPIFFSQKTKENFYDGFCNKTIWPLFHYFPSYTAFRQDYWYDYKKVNKFFSDELSKIIQKDDLIYVHDYHLMLLPKILRKKFPSIPIGFFLHIPFPSYEMFRLLPTEWRTEIISGLLGSDLIGFHTHDYADYFLRTVQRMFGHEHSMGKIQVNSSIVKVDAFPLGIDYEQYAKSSTMDSVIKEKERLIKNLRGCKVILSIDRLDYTKGVINRLIAYEQFLQANTKWHKKVILFLSVAPSRIGVEHYQIMKRQIDECIGRINGRYGTLEWLPVHYQYRSLSFDQITALYDVSDVALITPLRDGMNLIAKEYIATKKDNTGVLILSETAGASKELGEAVIVNPHTSREIAVAIKTALEMPRAQKIQRSKSMKKRLEFYTVRHWGEEFMKSLLDVKREQLQMNNKLLSAAERITVIDRYGKSHSRLFFLDYDGSLVPFALDPQNALPPKRVLSLLSSLASNPDNDVVIISGRDKSTLNKWFGKIPITILGEHGIVIRDKNNEWTTLATMETSWKSDILAILKNYTSRLLGSFIEEKEYSLAWHYRKSDSLIGQHISNELTHELKQFIVNSNLQILQGNKVIEIKGSNVTKGTAAVHLLSKKIYDFIFAIGDDQTDEDLFAVLPQDAISIKVGSNHSKSRFILKSPSDVLALLTEIKNVKRNEFVNSTFDFTSRSL